MSFDKLKVVELKKELKERGLKTFGKKAVLIARLNEYEAEKNAANDEDNINNDNVTNNKNSDNIVESLEKKDDSEMANERTIDFNVNNKTDHINESKQEINDNDNNNNNNKITEDSDQDNTNSEIKSTIKDDNDDDDNNNNNNSKNDNDIKSEEVVNMKRYETSNEEEDKTSKRVSEEEEKEEEASHVIQSPVIIVTGFVRPFLKAQAEALFKKYGKIKKFWMNLTKSKGIVQYETIEEAQRAYDAVNNIIWPTNSTSKLIVKQESVLTLENMLEEQRQKEIARQQDLQRREQGIIDHKPKSKDDGLRKTKATPHIYYKMVDHSKGNNLHSSRKRGRRDDYSGRGDDYRGRRDDYRGRRDDYRGRRDDYRGRRDDYRDRRRPFDKRNRPDYLDRTKESSDHGRKRQRYDSPNRWRRDRI